MDTSKVTHIEVIDHLTSPDKGGGRVFTFRDDGARVETSRQDDGGTLKIIITRRRPET